MTTRPLLSRTRATLRSAEFGFLGFVVPTFRHTPFRCGRSTSAGDTALRARRSPRQPRRTWFSVASARAVVLKKSRAPPPLLLLLLPPMR